jgi:hypothetical protein
LSAFEAWIALASSSRFNPASVWTRCLLAADAELDQVARTIATASAPSV